MNVIHSLALLKIRQHDRLETVSLLASDWQKLKIWLQNILTAQHSLSFSSPCALHEDENNSNQHISWCLTISYHLKRFQHPSSHRCWKGSLGELSFTAYSTLYSLCCRKLDKRRNPKGTECRIIADVHRLLCPLRSFYRKIRRE